MTNRVKDFNDNELNKVLAAASAPQLPMDFEARLAQRVAATASNNVILFPQRRAQPAKMSFRLPMVAALAASLMIGFWVGGSGQTTSLFEGLTETAMLGATQDFAPAGMEELGNLDVDNES